MFVKPAPVETLADPDVRARLIAEGRTTVLIRDPVTFAFLPEEGAEVDMDHPYWACRVRDGDVVAATPESDKTQDDRRPA